MPRTDPTHPKSGRRLTPAADCPEHDLATGTSVERDMKNWSDRMRPNIGMEEHIKERRTGRSPIYQVFKIAY